jgi:hypothetical protein
MAQLLGDTLGTAWILMYVNVENNIIIYNGIYGKF